MFLPRILESIDTSISEKYLNELLEMNQITKEHGLVLTPEEVKNMMIVRSQALCSYGRVELDIAMTKELVAVFCTSSYINNDNFATILNELHEIFYYLKNETEDQIGDYKLIHMMKDYFDYDCGGSLELLKSKIEGFIEDFRKGVGLKESLFERDEF
ncbi:DUF6323 family protein [Thermoflavimicrobium daqui]|jgi:hypothetical protein|uniref:Uncharacterized protein n=1 Tax=Thermoflavimicrobium daqui TaxID=2137476 RepID=A0A364K417_9BACL|nr:DUF6323 family protein [Thermoflavimicrobium daqui]RAL24105.1 hypothetical protein DL897_10455 [Thermoflavimicrobium daqui]